MASDIALALGRNNRDLPLDYDEYPIRLPENNQPRGLCAQVALACLQTQHQTSCQNGTAVITSFSERVGKFFSASFKCLTFGSLAFFGFVAVLVPTLLLTIKVHMVAMTVMAPLLAFFCGFGTLIFSEIAIALTLAVAWFGLRLNVRINNAADRIFRAVSHYVGSPITASYTQIKNCHSLNPIIRSIPELQRLGDKRLEGAVLSRTLRISNETTRVSLFKEMDFAQLGFSYSTLGKNEFKSLLSNAVEEHRIWRSILRLGHSSGELRLIARRILTEQIAEHKVPLEHVPLSLAKHLLPCFRDSIQNSSEFLDDADIVVTFKHALTGEDRLFQANRQWFFDKSPYFGASVRFARYACEELEADEKANYENIEEAQAKLIALRNVAEIVVDYSSKARLDQFWMILHEPWRWVELLTDSHSNKDQIKELLQLTDACVCAPPFLRRYVSESHLFSPREKSQFRHLYPSIFN